MKRIIFFIISTIFTTASCFANFFLELKNNNSKGTISGYVKDYENGELLIGANIFVKELKTGTTTNSYGFYSLTLPSGKYTLVYSFIGYEPIEKEVSLKDKENLKLDVSLKPKQINIKEVVITDKKTNENVTENQMGMIKLDMETIKKIPAFLGEVDLIKSIQLLPGVQTTGEGFSGFNVRGGSADQNLIILDEATVYNASHLMGFFSVFNSDAIKDAKIYKGDIPAEFGGRLSSLLDIRMKDGNLYKYKATGGIGTIASRLTIEGPIIKNKSSFIVSGRRTYADVFLALSKDSSLKKSRLYFYDFNAKVNLEINKNNRIYLSGYFGQDFFKFGEMFKLIWGNNTKTLRWNHLFSEKLFANFTLLHSEYNYQIKIEQAGSKFDWKSKLTDLSFKSDFNFYLNPNNTIKFGFQSTYHIFNPGSISDMTGKTLLEMPENYSIENSIFAQNEQNIKGRLTINYGLRYTLFQNIGKATVYNFDENYNYIDSTVYPSGKIFNTYHNPEPRFAFTYLINEENSFKGSYSHTQQYLQLASNSTMGLPIDVWFSASPNVKPQRSNQISLGYFKNFDNNNYESSIEMYYKYMDRQIDFKDNANLILNPKLEGEIRTGEVNAYGIELMLKKQTGRLSGIISYTFSKAEKKVKTINDDKPYPANYEKPHFMSLILSYDITNRISAGIVFVYSSGNPITLPTGKYEYGNMIIPVYSEKNGYRLPDYHRLDLSLTLKNKQKNEKRFHSEWNFSVYNAYNRKNAYTIYFERDKENPNRQQAYKLAMFGIIPAITYNFYF